MTERFVITTSDVVKITGKSESWATKRLNLIKDAIGKPHNRQITLFEYCDYEMFSIQEIKDFLHLS